MLPAVICFQGEGELVHCGRYLCTCHLQQAHSDFISQPCDLQLISHFSGKKSLLGGFSTSGETVITGTLVAVKSKNNGRRCRDISKFENSSEWLMSPTVTANGRRRPGRKHGVCLLVNSASAIRRKHAWASARQADRQPDCDQWAIMKDLCLNVTN